MDFLTQYTIPFSGLDDKEYSYDFTADDRFFEFFEKSEISGGKVDIDLVLIKRANSLHLKLSLKGFVKLACDRCLDEYSQEIKISDTIVVEFGEETNMDSDSDIVILSRAETEINISQFIYEYAHFALPLSRLHPLDNHGKSTCNPEMIKILETHLIEEEKEKVDPRWEKLIEIKNNNVK